MITSRRPRRARRTLEQEPVRRTRLTPFQLAMLLLLAEAMGGCRAGILDNRGIADGSLSDSWMPDEAAEIATPISVDMTVDGSSSLDTSLPVDGALPDASLPARTLPPGRPLVVLDPSSSAPVVKVAACGQLQAAIKARAGGGLIQIDDLSCSGDITIAVSGVGDTKPLVIRSKTRLGTSWSSGTWTISGSHVRIEGIHFKNGASVKLSAPSSRTRITRCQFSGMHTAACLKPYLLNRGANDHRFDHNRVTGGSGYQINFKYPSKYAHFDHNLFTDSGSCAEKTGTVMYLWQEHPKSVQEPFFVIEHNLFDYASNGGRIETKCSESWIRHNTFRGSLGGVRLRHGLNSHVHGNFMIDAMGITICGSGHEIYNNYLEGCSEGLRVQAGNVLPGKVPVGKAVVNGSQESPYEAVRDSTIANNTVITKGSGQQGVYIGFVWSQTTPLHDVQGTWFVNNLVYSPNSKGKLWTLDDQSHNTFDSNITFGASSQAPVSGLIHLDPALSLLAGLYRPDTSSANVVDMGTAVPLVKTDVDGQPRSAMDIGADEVSTAPVLYRPLTASDVGPSASAD